MISTTPACQNHGSDNCHNINIRPSNPCRRSNSCQIHKNYRVIAKSETTLVTPPRQAYKHIGEYPEYNTEPISNPQIESIYVPIKRRSDHAKEAGDCQSSAPNSDSQRLFFNEDKPLPPFPLNRHLYPSFTQTLTCNNQTKPYQAQAGNTHRLSKAHQVIRKQDIHQLARPAHTKKKALAGTPNTAASTTPLVNSRLFQHCRVALNKIKRFAPVGSDGGLQGFPNGKSGSFHLRPDTTQTFYYLRETHLSIQYKAITRVVNSQNKDTLSCAPYMIYKMTADIAN